MHVFLYRQVPETKQLEQSELATFLHNLFRKLLVTKTVTTMDAVTGQEVVSKRATWTEREKLSAHMQVAAVVESDDARGEALDDLHDSSLDMDKFETEEQKTASVSKRKHAFKMQLHKTLDKKKSDLANMVPKGPARKLPRSEDNTPIPLTKSDLESSREEETETGDVSGVDDEGEIEKKEQEDVDFLNDFSAMQATDFDEYAYELEGQQQQLDQRNKERELAQVQVKIVDKNDGVRVKQVKKPAKIRKKSTLVHHAGGQHKGKRANAGMDAYLENKRKERVQLEDAQRTEFQRIQAEVGSCHCCCVCECVCVCG